MTTSGPMWCWLKYIIKPHLRSPITIPFPIKMPILWVLKKIQFFQNNFHPKNHLKFNNVCSMGVQKLWNNKHAHHLINKLFNGIESEAWSAMVLGRVTTRSHPNQKQIDKQNTLWRVGNYGLENSRLSWRFLHGINLDNCFFIFYFLFVIYSGFPIGIHQVSQYFILFLKSGHFVF